MSLCSTAVTMSQLIPPLLQRRNAVVLSPSDLSAPKWRFQGKKGFFTWAQCPVSKEAALEQLTAALKTWDLVKYRIAREYHEDGEPHLHAFIQCRKKISTTNVHFVDLVDTDKNVYHGNYQTCRNPEAVKEYCKKDGDFIENTGEGLFATLIQVAADEGVKRALEVLKDQNPELYVRDSKRIKSNLQLAVPPAGQAVDPTFTFLPDPTAVKYWTLHKHEFSLWIRGKSNTGKSSYALSLFGGRGLLVSHMDQLKTLDPEYHTGLVFDDMSFTHWPRSSVIHLVDVKQRRAINVKHSVAILPAGFPRVFVSNDNIWPCEDKALKRRIVGWHVTEDLRVQVAPDVSNAMEPDYDMFHTPDTYFVFPKT